MAITILVKNPNAAHEECRIRYWDIGDYLSREQKLEALKEAGAISGISEWQTITPDVHYDWVGQRSAEFAQFYPLGSPEAKAGRADDAIFALHSLGLCTGKDAYLYNFSREICADSGRKMTQDYTAALTAMDANPGLGVDAATSVQSSHFKWDRVVKDNLRRKKSTEFDQEFVRKVAYRPFIATNCYADYTFVNCKYQINRIFPDRRSENRVVCVSGKGGTKGFSALLSDRTTDLQFMFNGQCFPRYRYQVPTEDADTIDALEGISDRAGRIDNISDTALRVFCDHYQDDTITKHAIFDYVYGVLHAPRYREEFAIDLSKEIPRIPFAPDFQAFTEAGRALGELHLGYERCERYPLELVFAHEGEPPQARHFRLTAKAMRFADNEKTTLRINEHVSVSGIPAEAHRYVVNGRTPLEWYIDRYRIKKDKESGILNDPNGWFADPRDLVAAIERIVYVSVESIRIIEELPKEMSVGAE